jgi:hypothetical protein
VALAGERCRSNVVISFVRDGAALVRDLSNKSPRLLAEVPPAKRDAMRDGTQPIRWWYSSELVGKGKRGMSGRYAECPVGRSRQRADARRH